MANCDYETNLNEYDDLDFIAENDDDEEEDQEQSEVEEEDEEGPSVGEQEILSLRERLKADLRRRNQGTGTACSSSPVQEPVRSTKFGNFFGPSRPALAPRLIEAAGSDIVRAIGDAYSRKSFAAPVASKEQANASTHQQKPKIISQVKRKADLLRENRDYSDLFSDVADVPPAKKELPDSMPVKATRSGVEVRGRMQPAEKTKVPRNPPARILKDHASIQNLVQSKAGSPRKDPLPNGKNMISAARNGSSSLPSMKRAPSLQPSSNGQNLQRSMLIKRQQSAPPAGQKQQQPPKTQLPPQPSSQSSRPQKLLLPPQSSSQVSRTNSFSVQSRNSAPKGSVQSRSRLAQKQSSPSLKAKPSQRNAVYDEHADKKRVVKRKCSEETEAILMIREMFNYNPEKFVGRDEDDSNMEADYRSIQMEEKRSQKLAKKEDEEQLRLLEEEKKSKLAKKIKK